MFDWLEDEMARIKTNKFHFVDGVASAEFRTDIESSDIPLPPSYKRFVLQFGNAELYRRDSYYYVTIFAGPREVDSSEGEAFIQFGRTHTSLSYFKESLLVPGEESPVFEWRHEQGLQQTANGFEEWLKAKCTWARQRYKKNEWQQIEKGPPPFTEQEQGIVEARRKYRWRVVGIAANGDIQFEVHNGSDLALPFLSIGVRGKHGKVNGGVWLPVSSVMPGQTAVIEKDCYKDLVPADQVEVFEQPAPEPEDRDRYWEFRAMA